MEGEVCMFKVLFVVKKCTLCKLHSLLITLISNASVEVFSISSLEEMISLLHSVSM